MENKPTYNSIRSRARGVRGTRGRSRGSNPAYRGGVSSRGARSGAPPQATVASVEGTLVKDNSVATDVVATSLPTRFEKEPEATERKREVLRESPKTTLQQAAKSWMPSVNSDNEVAKHRLQKLGLQPLYNKTPQAEAINHPLSAAIRMRLTALALGVLIDQSQPGSEGKFDIVSLWGSPRDCRLADKLNKMTTAGPKLDLKVYRPLLTGGDIDRDTTWMADRKVDNFDLGVNFLMVDVYNTEAGPMTPEFVRTLLRDRADTTLAWVGHRFIGVAGIVNGEGGWRRMPNGVILFRSDLKSSAYSVHDPLDWIWATGKKEYKEGTLLWNVKDTLGDMCLVTFKWTAQRGLPGSAEKYPLPPEFQVVESHYRDLDTWSGMVLKGIMCPLSWFGYDTALPRIFSLVTSRDVQILIPRSLWTKLTDSSAMRTQNGLTARQAARKVEELLKSDPLATLFYDLFPEVRPTIDQITLAALGHNAKERSRALTLFNTSHGNELAALNKSLDSIGKPEPPILTPGAALTGIFAAFTLLLVIWRKLATPRIRPGSSFTHLDVLTLLLGKIFKTVGTVFPEQSTLRAWKWIFLCLRSNHRILSECEPIYRSYIDLLKLTLSAPLYEEYFKHVFAWATPAIIMFESFSHMFQNGGAGLLHYLPTAVMHLICSRLSMTKAITFHGAWNVVAGQPFIAYCLRRVFGQEPFFPPELLEAWRQAPIATGRQGLIAFDLRPDPDMMPMIVMELAPTYGSVLSHSKVALQILLKFLRWTLPAFFGNRGTVQYLLTGTTCLALTQLAVLVYRRFDSTPPPSPSSSGLTSTELRLFERSTEVGSAVTSANAGAAAPASLIVPSPTPWDEFKRTFFTSAWEDRPAVNPNPIPRVTRFDPSQSEVPTQDAYCPIPEQCEFLTLRGELPKAQISREEYPDPRTTVFWFLPHQIPGYSPRGSDANLLAVAQVRILAAAPMEPLVQAEHWKKALRQVSWRNLIMPHPKRLLADSVHFGFTGPYWSFEKHPQAKWYRDSYHWWLASIYHNCPQYVYDPIVPLEFEEWLEHLDPKKRHRMIEARKVYEQQGEAAVDRALKGIKIMVKKDETLYRLEEDGTPQLKPRAIANVNPIVACVLGPYQYVLQQRLKEAWSWQAEPVHLQVGWSRHYVSAERAVTIDKDGCFRGQYCASSYGVQMVFASGMSDEELSLWFSEIHRNIETFLHNNTAYIIVAGDDGLIIYVDEFFAVVYIEIDLSMCDQTVQQGPLNNEFCFMKALGQPDHIIARFEECSRAAYVLVGRDKVDRATIDRSKRPMRDTGGTNTTTGNSIVVGNGMHYAIRQAFSERRLALPSEKHPGQPCVTDSFLKTQFDYLGFKVKMKLFYDPTAVTFLKGWWYRLSPEHMDTFPIRPGFYWGPLPSRVVKVGKCLRDPRQLYDCKDLGAAARRFLIDVAKGYEFYMQVPLLRAFVSKFAGQSDRPPEINWIEQHKVQAALGVEKPAYHDSFREQVCRRYDLTVEEIESFEWMFPRDPFNFFEHPVFYKLVAVDYN